MIYRKWSLLTMPAVYGGGIVAAVVVTNFAFVQNDWLLKREPAKHGGDSSTK